MIISITIIIGCLIVASIGLVRAVQRPGRRAALWWGLCILALTAALTNGQRVYELFQSGHSGK